MTEAELTAQLMGLTNSYVVVLPSQAKGLREAYAEATYEGAGVRLEVSGPLRTVVRTIKAAIGEAL